MKKFLVNFCAFCLFLSTLSGCNKVSQLSKYVSELRSDIYMGQCEDFTIKAQYGFTEQPFINDGKKGSPIYTLSFKLINKQLVNANYNITFNFNDKSYSKDFVLSPVSQALVASFPVENFNIKEFDCEIRYDSHKQNIRLKSIIPEDAITSDRALSVLEKEQPALVEKYIDNNAPFGEIHLRILVRKDKPYWYVGLIKSDEQQKALLIDGITGEILAIREIF